MDLQAAAKTAKYKDRWFRGTEEEYVAQLKKSTTVYVGNLSFYTVEDQVWELFRKVGEIKRIIMGLHRGDKSPCGFCFVEYYSIEDTLDCVRYINQARLDDRTLRVDKDVGFVEGRQYGRGRSGGQVRDEYRANYDTGRGGWGQLKRMETEGVVSSVVSPHLDSFSSSGPRRNDGKEPYWRKRQNRDWDDSGSSKRRH